MPTVDENFVKRIQPHSEEAERSVLGSMLMDRDAIVEAEDILTKEDFYQRQYGIVFEAMVELYREGKAVDLITLQNKLKEKEVPEELMSLDFFRDLVEVVPTAANIGQYAKIVHDKATLRALIKVTENIGNECYLGKEDTETILEKTEKDIFGLLQNRNRMSDFVPIQQIVLNSLSAIEEASKTKGRVTGVVTALVRSQEHSAMMISRDLKEKQDHRLLSYASQITMIPFRINRLHSTRFSFTIHLVSILQHTI